MKKVLLASTALILSAGVASAGGHLVWSGSAQAGVATDADDNLDVYSSANVEVTFSGTTDSGMEFGASMDATAGMEYDAGDFEFDGDADGTFGFGSAYISTGGLTLTFAREDIDDLYDDDMDAHDIQADYGMGPISISVTMDLDEDDALDVDVDGDAEFSYSVGYDQDGISAGIAGNDISGCTVLNVGYATGPISLGLESDQGCAGDTVNEVSVSYSVDAITFDASVDDADGWSAGVEYSADGLTVAAETDDADEWEVTGSLDLGGGASAIAGVNFDSHYYLGVEMSF
jgi:outer membrane protein OmpU